MATWHPTYALAALWVALLSGVAALDNGLGSLPPMGWNSWNLAGCGINETFFRATVDALAAGGFREAGYEYINLDDCWMDTMRSPEGDLQWGPNFPTGHTLGDYVHAKGFKFGMYLSAGPKTCSLNTCSHSKGPGCTVNRSATGWGSYGHEERDARWIAAQGADYLKYDGVCGGDYNMPPLNGSFGVLEWEQVVVSKMGVALNRTGRPIWYQYGSPYTWNKHGGSARGLAWITKNATLGGVNSFRSGFDMSDSWGNVPEQIYGVVRYNQNMDTRCVGACPWPDADCMEIGNNMTKIDLVQAQSYFSWYAIANAPLLMSTRIDTLPPAVKAIFQNSDVIAVNQDYVGLKGQPVTSPLRTGGTVWAKPLSTTLTAAPAGFSPNGFAAFLLNNDGCVAGDGACARNVTLYFPDLGLTPETRAAVKDVVTGKDLGMVTGAVTARLDWSESALLKITPQT